VQAQAVAVVAAHHGVAVVVWVFTVLVVAAQGVQARINKAWAALAVEEGQLQLQELFMGAALVL